MLFKFHVQHCLLQIFVCLFLNFFFLNIDSNVIRIIGACLIAGTFCSLQGENSQVNLKCGTSYDLSAKDPTLAASLETIVSKIENQFETKELCAINHVLGNSDAAPYKIYDGFRMRSPLKSKTKLKVESLG